MQTVLNWARSIKSDLVHLQAETRIPALWAAAQMSHESYDDSGGMTRLAIDHHNHGGLKWAPWEAEYGCSPVRAHTWEVLKGVRTNVEDAFCSCPSWQIWLAVYSALLTSGLYEPALLYASDPLLYGYRVWLSGYATDPEYVIKTAGWMRQLWSDYKDTLPRLDKTPPPPREEIPIRVGTDDAVVAKGWLQDGVTVAPLRVIAEAAGAQVDWDPATRSVRVTQKGA